MYTLKRLTTPGWCYSYTCLHVNCIN